MRCTKNAPEVFSSGLPALAVSYAMHDTSRFEDLSDSPGTIGGVAPDRHANAGPAYRRQSVYDPENLIWMENSSSSIQSPYGADFGCGTLLCREYPIGCDDQSCLTGCDAA